jgi:hypothetical protein
MNFISQSSSAVCVVILLTLGSPGCKDKGTTSGLVVDAGTTTTATPVDAGGPVDVMQCPGCQLAPQGAWTFEGIYSDANCTEPLAQIVTPACAAVPALGPTPLTYVDEVGLRKAGENASVTLGEQVAGATVRYRKAGKACVHANEAATDLTPTGCAGQRVCRDQTGALACASCRTFGNGCPDFEETRTYATIVDPGLKTKSAPGVAPGGNMARLAQCCNALSAQAKALGASPEAGVIASAAAQCLAMVKAAGPNGNAPELGALKTLLAGRSIPAICAGF